MNKLIAPKQFYLDTARLAIPVALQNLMSSCLGLVDTMMVSRIGMVSAVGTAAQVDNINTLLALGATSGTAIFLAQYIGAGDQNRVKKTFGLSILLSAGTALLLFLLSALFPHEIIHFYAADEHTRIYGVQYLQIVKYGFLPGSMAFAFSYAFRSGKNATCPLVVSTAKMLLNIVLNSLLIFGLGPIPALGVRGAAIATVISQWSAVLAYVVYSYRTGQQFIGSFSQMFRLQKEFVVNILNRIYPLILNEVFFGVGETLYIRAFSVLGLVAMDAYFVGSKIASVFFILTMGISSAATVIMGQALGEGDIPKAKQLCGWFFSFAGLLSLISAGAIILFAGPMVMLFGLENGVTITLAIQVIRVLAVKIALRMFIVVAFSALRAGGDSKFQTFLDCGVMWLVGIPVTFFAVHGLELTSISLVLLLAQTEHLARFLLGVYRLKSGKWAVNLTKQN